MANFLKQYVVKIAQASSSSLEILTETSGSQFCTKPDAVSVSVFTKYFHLLFVREPQSSPAAAATVNQILKRPSWYKSGGKMSLAIVENNAKKTIKKLSLHKRRPRWARLDFIPFVVLYIIPIAIYFSIDATDESTRFSRLVALSCEGLLLLAHVMVFLMQQWSKAIKCFVGYSPVQAIHEATHVLAEPFEHCGCSAICSIAANKSPEDGKIQYSFRFQRLVYRYFDQHSTPSTKGLSTSIDTIAKTAGFTRLEYPTSNLLSTYHTTKGMSSSTYKLSQLYFGLNIIELPIPPFLELFADHLLAPFFVFQVFCVALWMLDEYWYYALFTLVMLLVFESTVCYTRVVSMKNLRGQARPSQQVYVYRDNKWSSHPVDSRELVPGDIISLSVSSSSTNTTDADDGNSTRSGKTIPCDALLLYGSAVVNEAMLTGESVPLLKEAMVVDGTESLRFTDGTDKQHQKNVVFSGTEILKLEDTTTSSSGTASDQQNITSSRRIPKPPDKGAVAYVLRTGFGTTQGELMRTILFATERVSVGDSETLLLLLIMLVFAIIASSYVLHEGLKDITASRWKLFLHCTMICTSVVPPELPMELSLAVTNSLNALRDRMIFCVEPFRIPYAGKVDICCFDKTGTLTSDQFRVNGVVAVKNGGGNSVEGSRKKENGSKENEEKESVSSNSSYSSSFEMIHDITKVDINVARVLGCCNSIIWLNGEMAGDPMEVATVKALEWSVRGNMAVPNDNSSLPIEIIKRYGFSSSLKRMSVIVKVRVSNKISDNEYYILTKGAPEVMATLYEQVPQGYDSEQHQYTSKGRRVLSLGYKHLKHLKNIHQLEKIDRSSLESNLICCGFLVLDSPLKPQSKPAITQLIRSSHRVVIITGDNPLTACSVASQVHVLSKPRRLQLILKEDLIWYPVDSNITNTIPFDGGSDEHHCSKHFKSLITNSYELCVTGGALIALANKYGDQINNINFDHQVPPSYIMKSLVINVLVFARTAPVQKERILTTLKTNGYTTLMCGDGTNDVGALKQADVGISIINSIEMDQMAEKVSNAAKYNNKNKKNKSNFNEQQLNQLLREMEMESKEQNIQLGDASVASGFTSKTASIACALDVIRQGRCTLVTTLQMYKILAVNCLVTAYNLSALYVYGVKQGDSQMTFVGLAVAGFFFFVSRSKPLMTLAPKRPPSRVFSRFVLLSVFGQSIVHFAVQLLALKWSEPFIDPSDPSMLRDGDFRPNVINTVVFIGSIVTQANSFGANYTGEPFMESFRNNKMLSRSLFLAWFTAFICATDIFPPINDLLQLVPLPSNHFRLQIIGLYLVDTVLIFTIEHFVRKFYGTEKSKLEQS